MRVPMDDSSEDNTEEILVYIDIDPTSLPAHQIKEFNNIKFFGLDMKKPLLQIKNQFFEGEYDYSMGTHLFFEKNEEAPVDELYCKCDSYYQYRLKTNKVVRMSRVLLRENCPNEKLSHEKAQDEDIPVHQDQLKVTKTYEEALNLFLIDGKDPPRKIPEETNCSHLKKFISTEEHVDDEHKVKEKNKS